MTCGIQCWPVLQHELDNHTPSQSILVPSSYEIQIKSTIFKTQQIHMHCAKSGFKKLIKSGFGFAHKLNIFVLNIHFLFPDWICSFEKPKTEPNTLSPSTTVLSPYLKFGCLSARKFYWDLQDVYTKKVINC